MTDLTAYPGVAGHLDDTLPDLQVEKLSGDRLLVRQTGPDGGLQSLFSRRSDGSYEFLRSDDVLDLATTSALLELDFAASSAGDCAAVAARMRDEVGKMSSRQSPPGQAVACVWAVRTLVHAELRRWITRTDGTAQFGRELKSGFSDAVFREADLPEGAIVISPSRRHHGHVGLLGERIGEQDRAIYSNSSRDGVWERNWSLERWRPHYEGLGLEMLFYPLPVPR